MDNNSVIVSHAKQSDLCLSEYNKLLNKIAESLINRGVLLSNSKIDLPLIEYDLFCSINRLLINAGQLISLLGVMIQSIGLIDRAVALNRSLLIERIFSYITSQDAQFQMNCHYFRMMQSCVQATDDRYGHAIEGLSHHLAGSIVDGVPLQTQVSPQFQPGSISIEMHGSLHTHTLTYKELKNDKFT